MKKFVRESVKYLLSLHFVGRTVINFVKGHKENSLVLASAAHILKLERYRED